MPNDLSKKSTEVYQFASLADYSWRERLAIRAADFAFYVLISLIGKTIRYEVEGWENFEAIYQNGKVPIYAFWHNKIFAGTYYFRRRGIVIITSQSFDGEYIARFIQRFGYGTVRGSSTRGGTGALIEMIRLMRENVPTGLTVDGPKGPKYEAKTGAILLAKKSGQPIMPFTVTTKKHWTINSWDKLQIPKLFTRAKVIIAAPVYVEKNADDAEIENKRRELQTKLEAVTALGERWREDNK